MQSYIRIGRYLAIAAFIGAAASAQEAPKPREGKPLPPRIAPTDYQSHAQAGAVTIAADFAAHGVPTPDGTFSTEQYVVVEAAVYGQPGAHLNLSFKDFSLRINGKKGAIPAQPYEVVFSSLKDPEWEPAEPVETKSQTSLNTGGGRGGSRGGGGGGSQGDAPPPPPKMPMPLVIVMEQKVKMASLPDGDRPLPTAGLLFFQYGGKSSGIRSLELIYAGAAGKASLPLQ